MAEATQERKLLGVGSTAWFGVGLGQQAPGLIRAQLSQTDRTAGTDQNLVFFIPISLCYASNRNRVVTYSHVE